MVYDDDSEDGSTVGKGRRQKLKFNIKLREILPLLSRRQRAGRASPSRAVV